MSYCLSFVLCPWEKKPGFYDNFCIISEVGLRNPVSGVINSLIFINFLFFSSSIEL